MWYWFRKRKDKTENRNVKLKKYIFLTLWISVALNKNNSCLGGKEVLLHKSETRTVGKRIANIDTKRAKGIVKTSLLAINLAEWLLLSRMFYFQLYFDLISYVHLLKHLVIACACVEFNIAFRHQTSDRICNCYWAT